MTIEQEIQRITELWHNIEPKIKGDLANLWEERHELGELEARVEALEPKVIKLLEVIPTLKRHSHEYHARTVDLVKLLHHFSKYETNELIQKVTSDLEYFSTEISKARNEAGRILQSRLSSQKLQYQPSSEEEKRKLIDLWEDCKSQEKFSNRVDRMGYKFETYSGRDPYNQNDCSSENIWIVSKEAKGFLFPAWNRMPAYGLRFFYKLGANEYRIIVIKKLVEVVSKNGEWQLFGEKGEIKF